MSDNRRDSSSRPTELAQLGPHRTAPLRLRRHRQVFCNRNMAMRKIRLIGFDMDYTLAPYEQSQLEAVSIQTTVEKLIREKGYPEELREIRPDPRFALRGLMVDKVRGNLLKLDCHRYAGRVYHGLHPVEKHDRHSYHRQPLRLDPDRYVLIDTLFALPEVSLFAHLVDLVDRREGGRQDYRDLFEDIRWAIDRAHADGSIKDLIRADLPRYIRQDSKLGLTLHRLRSAGKQLFLLTNSEPDYTDTVMSYLLDGVLPDYPSWKTYFDIIVTAARKPAFFTSEAPFVELTAGSEPRPGPVQAFRRGTIYQGGNFADFQRLAGYAGDDVLYIGDHIYGDILRSRRSSAWRTVMIIQEMEDEIRRLGQLGPERRAMLALDDELQRLYEESFFQFASQQQIEEMIERERRAGREPSDLIAQLDRRRRRLRTHQDVLRRRIRQTIRELEEHERTIANHFNPYWGSLFKEGNESSIFGKQVADYACLYTSRVSNFLAYSPTQTYRSPRDILPHELGL